ncbi:MAG: hypothetical protein FJX65_05005 [Alphaproteobacteria bacterium]|nr:hypothetical protein [Alphaproteobacteria bacterium]
MRPLAIWLLCLAVGCTSRTDNIYEIDAAATRVIENNGGLVIRSPDGRHEIINVGGSRYNALYDAAKACAAESKPAGAEAACGASRNAIIAEWIRISDDMCRRHLADVQSTSAVVNVGLSGITTLGSALATVVGSGATPAALSATAAITNSLRSTVNEEVYMRSIVPQLTDRTRTDRAGLGNQIREKMGRDTAYYSIDIAVIDLAEYHASCSFARGLEKVSKALQQPSKETLQARLEAVQSFIERSTQEISGLETKSAQAPEAERRALTSEVAKRRGEIEALIQERTNLRLLIGRAN